MPPQDLLGLTALDLARAVRDVAPEPYRAAQIAKWIYERRAASFAEMSNLPKVMREALAKDFTIGLPKAVTRTPAPDGTEKFLFELADGARVEAVYIVESKKKPSWTDPDTPEAARITICLSSQAGCAVDCVFCVTGRMGAGRNLTAGEIVGQYLVIAKEKGFGPHEANVVFMGMGEPLLNVANVVRALDLLEEEVSPKRTTVSTAGVVPGIETLAGRPHRPNLAVSLSAADDETRTKLMPINRTYPIAALIAALKRWPLEHYLALLLRAGHRVDAHEVRRARRCHRERRRGAERQARDDLAGIEPRLEDEGRGRRPRRRWGPAERHGVADHRRDAQARGGLHGCRPGDRERHSRKVARTGVVGLIREAVGP